MYYEVKGAAWGVAASVNRLSWLGQQVQYKTWFKCFLIVPLKTLPAMMGLYQNCKPPTKKKKNQQWNNFNTNTIH